MPAGDAAQTRQVSRDQPADPPVDLGMALRALRRRRDVSQRRLAELAGVPANTVARIESGENSNPRIRTVERLARAAGGGVWVGPAPDQPATPVPHERQTDAGDRHYPAHLDVTVTYPYVGRDRRILPAGTAVYTYDLDRGRREDARAQAAAVAELSVERFERPGGGWLWVARTGTGEVAGRLGAVLLGPGPMEPREVVLCAVDVIPAWRWSTLGQRLLGQLREELAELGPIELVTLSFGGMESEHLRRLGFHSRSTNVFLLAGRP